MPAVAVADCGGALLIVGQAAEIAEAEDTFCTGLVPVVGHGLVFNWVKFEAPVKGLMGPALGGTTAWVCTGCCWVPQFAAAQLGENPRFSITEIQLIFRDYLVSKIEHYLLEQRLLYYS